METEKNFSQANESEELKSEMSLAEFEAAVIRKPELLKFILIDKPMELLDKVQKAIDASPNSSDKESRQKIVDDLRDFYSQRLDR